MSTLGDKLRELRGETSQSEMARTLKMARPQWIRYENGTSVPGADIIEKICRVHACSADWLLGLKDKSPTVSAGPGAAVAIGANARASAHTAEAKTACRNCRYKKMFDAYEAAAKKART